MAQKTALRRRVGAARMSARACHQRLTLGQPEPRNHHTDNNYPPIQSQKKIEIKKSHVSVKRGQLQLHFAWLEKNRRLWMLILLVMLRGLGWI